MFLIGGKIFQGVREAGSLEGGINLEIAKASLDRGLGLVVLITVVVGLYLVMQEISRAMGKGALFRLFFERPAGVANRILTSKQPDETPCHVGDDA